MRRGLLLLPVALALTVGCSGGSSVSTQHLATTQQASPRQQADRDARELLTHVRVPPSSTTTRTAPTSRLDAPFEQPAESSLVDRHQLWRVGMTLGATAAWLRSHS